MNVRRHGDIVFEGSDLPHWRNLSPRMSIRAVHDDDAEWLMPTAIQCPPPGIDLVRVRKQQLASLPQVDRGDTCPTTGDNIDLDSGALASSQTRAAVSWEMDEKRWPVGIGILALREPLAQVATA